MRLLRSLLFIVAALLLQSCLWRPPPIPPNRTGADSGVTNGADSSGVPPFSDAGAAQDSSAPSDSGFVSDHDAQPDAAESDGSATDADSADSSEPDASEPDAAEHEAGDH
jgi:hypothetical protein